jgi:hypothetical protein
MSGKKRFIVLGVVTLVIGIVTMFPARSAYSLFAPASLQLSGIDGTIWRGTASEGLAGGIYLRNLSWKFKPLSLLTAQLAFSTQFDPASGFVDADVAVSAGGSITLSAISGEVPINLLHSAAPPLRGIQGMIGLQLQQVVIENQVPTTVEGIITVSELTAAMLSRAPIGNFEAAFSTDSGGIKGIVKDVSGVLAVSGVLTVSENREYSLVGQVATRPATPSAIVQQLEMLGSMDDEGNREFRIEGQL